jgi:hypothetical protein
MRMERRSIMDAEAANRIDVDHTPRVVYGLDGVTSWVCACSSPWPCRRLQPADDARRERVMLLDRFGNGS